VETAETHRHLFYAWIERTGVAIYSGQESEFVGSWHAGSGLVTRIQWGSRGGRERPFPALGTASDNSTRGVTSPLQSRKLDIVAISEALFFGTHGAHAHALIEAELSILDDPIFQNPRLRTRTLKIEIGRIHGSYQQSSKRLLEIVQNQSRIAKQRIS
jgi:hypothetical protein